MPHAQMISVADESTRKMIIGHKVVARFSEDDMGLRSQTKEGIIIEAHEGYCLALFGEKEEKIRWGQVVKVFY